MDSVQRLFLLALAVRLLLDLLFMLNVIPLDLRYKWYLQHGGDQDYYVALARSLIAGAPIESVVGIGQALMMVPWILLLHPFYYTDMVVPMVLVNGFLLGGLSVFVVGGIARAVTGDDLVAVGTALVWSALPLISYVAFFWHPEAVILRSIAVPRIGWLNGLSDGPALFLLLIAVLLLARLQHQPEPGVWPLAGVGVALSLAVTFRFHMAFAAAPLLFYVLLRYSWRTLAVVSGAGLVAYLPQAIYNQVIFGWPFTTGYFSYGVIGIWGSAFARPLKNAIAFSYFDPRSIATNMTHLLASRPWLIGIGLVALLLVGASLLTLWRRRGWVEAFLVSAPAVCYLIPMMMASNFKDDVIRFTLPVMPVAIILGIYFIVIIGRRIAAGPTPSTPAT